MSELTFDHNPSGTGEKPSILIVGAGAFGLSTGMHLSQAGYTDITILDPHPVPSQLSAATDVNKIIRTEYHYPLYGGLAREALAVWQRDPLFAPHFHQVGWYTGTPRGDERGEYILDQIWKEIEKDGVTTSAKRLERLSEMKKYFPQTSQSKDLGQWRGIFNPEAGWAHSGDAMVAVADLLKSRGVRFIHGTDGTFDHLHQDQRGQAVGVVSISGKVYLADRIVLAMGASTGPNVDTKDSLRAHGYAVAKVQLDPDEARLYKNMPVLHSKTCGYIFEPSDDNRIKIALNTRYAWYGESTQTGAGPEPGPGAATNTPSVEPLSISYGNLPLQCRRDLRRLLQIFLPQLADRPFCYEQFCWDADTNDDNFLIDFLPHTDNRVLLATGGSYHGFKFFPILGKYIVQALEGKLDAVAKKAWAWRPELPNPYTTRGKGETYELKRQEYHL